MKRKSLSTPRNPYSKRFTDASIKRQIPSEHVKFIEKHGKETDSKIVTPATLYLRMSHPDDISTLSQSEGVQVPIVDNRHVVTPTKNYCSIAPRQHVPVQNPYRKFVPSKQVSIEERIAIAERSIDDASLQQLMDYVEKKTPASYPTIKPRRLDTDLEKHDDYCSLATTVDIESLGSIKGNSYSVKNPELKIAPKFRPTDEDIYVCGLDDNALSEMMDRIESKKTSPNRRINLYRDSVLKFSVGERAEVDACIEVHTSKRQADIAYMLKQQALLKDYLDMEYTNLVRKKQKQLPHHTLLREKLNYIARNEMHFSKSFVDSIHSVMELGNMARSNDKRLPPRDVLERMVRVCHRKKELYETLTDADEL